MKKVHQLEKDSKIENIVSNDYKELVTHGTPDFPVAFYENEMRSFKEWKYLLHWHPQAEIITVENEQMDIQVGMKHIFKKYYGTTPRNYNG